MWAYLARIDDVLAAVPDERQIACWVETWQDAQGGICIQMVDTGGPDDTMPEGGNMDVMSLILLLGPDRLARIAHRVYEEGASRAI